MKKNTLRVPVTQKIEDFSPNNLKRTQQVIFLNLVREGLIDNLDEYFKNGKKDFMDGEFIRNALKIASTYNRTDIVQYFLESPVCKPFFEQEDYQLAFVSACSYGELNLIKYLLMSPKLDKHADVNLNTTTKTKEIFSSNSNNGVIAAIMRNQLKTIEFLIFDMNVQYSKKIKDYLRRNPNELVTKMFKVKLANDKLNQSLPINQIEPTIKKNIKI